jgi:hypothetical protein
MTVSELGDFDPQRGGELVKEWFRTTICPSLGEEGFDDCYTTILDEAYDCPGDDIWYSFKEPQSAFSRALVLSTEGYLFLCFLL